MSPSPLNPPHTCTPKSHPSSLPIFTSLSLSPSPMADRTPSQRPHRPTTTTATTNNHHGAVADFLRKFQSRSPNATQLAGFLTLLISGSILLLLTGVTITASVLGLVLFAPLILLSSPIWVPVGAILFFVVAGFLSFCGFGVAAVAGLSWMYRYFRGMNPPGSGQVDYARSRIYDTASHVKDYAREYGGYLQSKVKDAAPGA